MKKLLLIPLMSSFLLAQNLELEPNKTYILSFFASWCSSCKKEIPELSKLQKFYEQQGIEIVGIDVDKDPKEAQAFQEKLKEYFTFRVIDDSANVIIKEYKPMGMPALYIVKNNQVCAKLFGALPHLKESLDEALNECKE
jgi:thiol-disulfide isomerase/thioredoxin